MFYTQSKDKSAYVFYCFYLLRRNLSIANQKNANESEFCEFTLSLLTHKQFSNLIISQFNISNLNSFNNIPLEFKYTISENHNNKALEKAPSILTRYFQILDKELHSATIDTNCLIMETILGEINASSNFGIRNFSDIDTLVEKSDNISFHQAQSKSPLAITFKWD